MTRHNYSTYADRDGTVHLLDNPVIDDQVERQLCYHDRPTAADQGIIYDYSLAERIVTLLNQAEGGAR